MAENLQSDTMTMQGCHKETFLPTELQPKPCIGKRIARVFLEIIKQ